METQQLHKTIEQQNQLILAKDKYIEDLECKLKKTRSELYDLQWYVSDQKYWNIWCSEAIRQKSVDIIGGFEHNTRYIPLGVTVTLVLFSIMFTIVMLLWCR